MRFGLLLFLAVLAAPAAQLQINIGTPGRGTGDVAHVAFGKVNTNFAELYGATLLLTNAPHTGTLFVQTNETIFEPDTSGQSLLSSGVGSLVISSNAWLPGRTFAVKASGRFANIGGPSSSAVLAWKLGSVVLLSNLMASCGTDVDQQWHFEGRVTVRGTGTAAPAVGSGWLTISTNGFIPVQVSSVINTTTNATMDLTWRHSVSSANNTVFSDAIVIRADY